MPKMIHEKQEMLSANKLHVTNIVELIMMMTKMCFCVKQTDEKALVRIFPENDFSFSQENHGKLRLWTGKIKKKWERRKMKMCSLIEDTSGLMKVHTFHLFKKFFHKKILLLRFAKVNGTRTFFLFLLSVDVKSQTWTTAIECLRLNWSLKKIFLSSS